MIRYCTFYDHPYVDISQTIEACRCGARYKKSLAPVPQSLQEEIDYYVDQDGGWDDIEARHATEHQNEKPNRKPLDSMDWTQVRLL